MSSTAELDVVSLVNKVLAVYETHRNLKTTFGRWILETFYQTGSPDTSDVCADLFVVTRSSDAKCYLMAALREGELDYRPLQEKIDSIPVEVQQSWCFI